MHKNYNQYEIFKVFNQVGAFDPSIMPFRYNYDKIDFYASVACKKWNKSEYEEDNDFIKRDSFFYLILGKVTNMNTLLSEERANFIEQSGISKRMWSRVDILNFCDKNVFDIYKEVYTFMGKDVVSIQTPLLIDYISANATTLQDAINMAFELKKNKDIVVFRHTMNLLDDAINAGNVLLIKEYKDILVEIVDQFTRKEINSKIIDLRFTLTPSLVKPSVSASFGIPIKFKSKKKINMNFLISLMQYGLSQVYRNKIW